MTVQAPARRRPRKTRRQRALDALGAAEGDMAKLAVAFDWFRAEAGVYMAENGQSTQPVKDLLSQVWQYALALHEANSYRDELPEPAARSGTPQATRKPPASHPQTTRNPPLHPPRNPPPASHPQWTQP